LSQKYVTVSIRFLFLVLLTMSLSCKKNGTDTGKDQDNQIPAIPGWDLVWNDEFKSTSINTTKWTFEVNAQGGGNNELQYYTDRPVNAYIENEALVITALKETFTGVEGTRDFTSARLVTKNKGDWKYGRLDIRAKLPYGQGLWPAIWMMPAESVYGVWAASGEIDIVELLGQEPNKVYGTLHYGGQWPNNAHSGGFYVLPQSDFSKDFHLFTLEWDTTEFRWYVDGNHYLTQNNWYTTNFPFPAPFNQKFFLILNVAVGGNWPGSPDLSTPFPQMLTVDYVRVYKKHE